jgi:multiple sugar transport system ATP-binding protein
VARIRLEGVSKSYGRVQAIKSLDLDIEDGEFFCILGPPSSGKTTTLRLIVGLERPDEGTVYINDRAVNQVHPGQRDIAMIFQNLALYPDKTVFDNIAFPLREQKVPASEIRERVTAVARTLRIELLLERKPGKLSGGERQRVAIGRAIVRRPHAYLMDAPLANLDALLREEMRVELKHLQQDLGQTLVYVTNDQIEAMSMADRITVLDRGVLQQCDTPMQVYNRPANCFVATLVGSPPTNLIRCCLQARNGTLQIAHQGFVLESPARNDPLGHVLAAHAGDGGKIILGVRPEDIRLHDQPRARQAVPARVLVVEPLGSETIADVRLGSDIIKVVVPPTQSLRDNQEVWLEFDLARMHLFDTTSERRVYSMSGEESLECVVPSATSVAEGA